ncbi:porin [Longimonas halophila]|uniref:Porin n=1 Tax=Longimonas halophila TaxID=1469170 RepID=A0A2H3P985_9BACT|nr:porin [Longimonas halophila]PEN08481.1 porin [Longimonas halophila]
MKPIRKISHYATAALFGVVLLFGTLAVSDAQAQSISMDTDDGWNFGVAGAIPVFLNASGHEGARSDGENQFATRIQSGFNPGNITFSVNAPEQNGVNVSATFQINHHLQGASVQNDGLFEGRVADIAVSGDFGTFNIGKGFGIFGGSAIADQGSAMGVGRFGGPDAADATLGRIGTGYTYANFNPRITYTTPNLDGFSLKLGLINPEKPGGAPNQAIETTTPRFEGQANYLAEFEGGTLDLWVGGLYQNVDVIPQDFSYSINGWDVGASLSAGGFGLRGAFSQTQSIGSDGLIGLGLDSGSGLDQAEADGTQWYGEATYDFGGFVLGGSYGEGSHDETSTDVGGVPENTNQLLMGFARYMATDQLTLMAEFQDFQSDAQADYNAFILGAQITF